MGWRQLYATKWFLRVSNHSYYDQIWLSALADLVAERKAFPSGAKSPRFFALLDGAAQSRALSRHLISLIVLTLIFCFSLPQFAAAKKLNVITATTDMAALAQEVGGDRVSVDAIAKGYQDPHFVEAKPSFLLKLRQADLLIVVGLHLRGFGL